jgi:hypothetical protein
MKKYTFDFITELTLSLLSQDQSLKKLIEMKQKLKHLSFKIVRNTQRSNSMNDQQFNNLMNEVSRTIVRRWFNTTLLMGADHHTLLGLG